MAKVLLNGVEKVYPNGTKAVSPTSVEINDGEFVVLVGPSGCGKSTMLRMIAGLEKITSGELSIDDKVVNSIEPANRDIAMVFQNYALYPHMTVRKNIGYGLKNRGIPKVEIDKKVNEAAKTLNLSEYLDSKPSQLSGGQRQRVAMGRAIVRDPKLFLFDEPLSNLDAKLRNQMRLEIKSLQRRLGVTSMYVTHDQVEAMTMADRIIVLNLGVVEQVGTPDEVYSHPASKFVASFMGVPPMNLIECDYKDTKVLLNQQELAQRELRTTETKVIFGLRPEDVILCDDSPHKIEMNIVEELGAHRLAHGTFHDNEFSVYLDKDIKLNLGEHCIKWDPAKLSFFDIKTEKRL